VTGGGAMRAFPWIPLFLVAMTGIAWANAADLAKAGFAAQQKGDWDTAVGLYSQALASGELSEKGTIQIMGLRANAYGSKGAADKAVADFTEVIKRAPADPMPLVGRSIAYRQLGKYDLAVADADAALKLKSDYVFAYVSRAAANFYAGQFARAVEDYAKAQASDPSDPDLVLWLHVSRARACQDDAEELARNAAKLDLNVWSGAAVAFYLGRLKPEEVKAASADPNPFVKVQQGCEASFYLAEDALLRAKSDDAKRLFQEVLDGCAAYKANYVYFSNVYGAAKEELKRLGS
jgi:lipoprotein NlpI